MAINSLTNKFDCKNGFCGEIVGLSKPNVRGLMTVRAVDIISTEFQNVMFGHFFLLENF